MKMKRLSLILIAALLCACSAHAQFRFGLKGGLVVSRLSFDNKVLSADIDIELMIDPDAEETPALDFYLCPVCGHLAMEEPEENCPVCHSDKDRQIKLKNGELPPREEGTFVTVPD